MLVMGISKKSIKAVGLGKDIRRWIAAIYDNERPPERKIKMNREKSYQFSLPLGSGVAQGSPLSPPFSPALYIHLLLFHIHRRIPLTRNKNMIN